MPAFREFPNTEHLPSLIPCNSALSTTQLNGIRFTVTVFLPTLSLNNNRLESVCGVAPVTSAGT